MIGLWSCPHRIVLRLRRLSDVRQRGKLIERGAHKIDRRRMATEGEPERCLVRSLWSALQTHLQGIDRAARAVVHEESRHRTALLARVNEFTK
jgi:hypothetical protein